MITDEMLTTYALPVLLTALILYMGFIVYRLGRDSKAGKWGMFTLYLGLMVGVLGFGLKYIIKYYLENSLD